MPTNDPNESRVGIILPTYCEAANIEILIRQIESLDLCNLNILVIDDSSPDDTAECVRRLQKVYKNIDLVVRPGKAGLGSAITDGFKAFLSMKNAPDYIVTMDADLSHDPQDIPRLVKTALKGHGLVIGNRLNSPNYRRSVSLPRRLAYRALSLMSAFTVGARISDYTSGMRCYSLPLVRTIVNRLHCDTYEIQIETVRRAQQCGFRITETPISFTHRQKGKSKLTLRELGSLFTYLFLKKTYPWIDYDITTDAMARKCMMNVDSLTEKMLIELLERLQKEKKEAKSCFHK